MSLHPQKSIRQHINLPKQVPEACSSKHQKHHRGENITMLLETPTGVGSISWSLKTTVKKTSQTQDLCDTVLLLIQALLQVPNKNSCRRTPHRTFEMHEIIPFWATSSIAFDDITANLWKEALHIQTNGGMVNWDSLTSTLLARNPNKHSHLEG